MKSATDEIFVSYYLFRIGLFSSVQLTDLPQDASILPFVIGELDGFSWGRHADFDVIVGMDILSQCDIALDRSGTCKMLFG